jgi:hypothetical protein
VTRPVCVCLIRPHEAWREVPMPGSNLPLELVRLDAVGDVLAMYAHFPQGFERPTSGGYDVAEEFLVLDGELRLDDWVLHRGDLSYIPAGTLRRSMSSATGCTVLAWFGGPANFRPAAELVLDAAAGDRRTLSVLHAPVGELLAVPSATWTVHADASTVGSADDVIDLGLQSWSRTADWRAGRLLVRSAH